MVMRSGIQWQTVKQPKSFQNGYITEKDLGILQDFKKSIS
jgi:hypothetical protein